MATEFLWRQSCLWSLGIAVLVVSACGGGDVTVAGEVDRPAAFRVGPQAPERQNDAVFDSGEDIRVEREQHRSTGGFSVDLSQREAVRLFYATVYNASEGVDSEWTGSISGCIPGDTSAVYKEAVLRRLNWFRAMAGVPATVQFDATFNRKAQQAALVMAANNNLSHTPPNSWACNNADATEAAGNSNLALGRSGADSVAGGYIADSGSNNTAVGHRRWVLYPQTQTMGTGDVTGTTQANALWVFDNRFGAARPSVRDEFVAWPPPGYVPYTTVYPRWSFSYPKADFSSASVSMSENGASIATRQEALSSGAGENTLVWLPGTYTDGMSWLRPSADTAYLVQISGVKINGVSRNFSYTVRVFDPDVATQTMALAGNDTATLGQSSPYRFVAVPGAMQYQWRSLQVGASSFNDGAEGDLSQFMVTTSPGYAVLASGVAASGGRSFHLAHPEPVDQVLVMQGDWVPAAQTRLVFSSRLGLASPSQRARVEVSQDGGASWMTLFEQAGTQSGSTSSFGETTFSEKQIALAAYSGRTIQLRFRYAFAGGSYYPQTSTTAGWFVDDIRLDSVSRITGTGAPTDMGSATQFNFIPTQAGSVLLQVRPGMYGVFGEWSLAKSVEVSAASNLPLAPPVGSGASDVAIDCLFNWAQRHYPSVLLPATALSQTLGTYRYRFYSQTGIYLAVSSADQALYLLQGNQLQSGGSVSNWLIQASCAGL